MLCSSYDPQPNHWTFKRVSTPAPWAERLKPRKPWVVILGEVLIGVILAIGLVMAL